MKLILFLVFILTACSSNNNDNKGLSTESFNDLLISSTDSGVEQIVVDPEQRFSGIKNINSNSENDIDDFIVGQDEDVPIALKGSPSNDILVGYLTQGYLQTPETNAPSLLEENAEVGMASMTAIEPIAAVPLSIKNAKVVDAGFAEPMMAEVDTSSVAADDTDTTAFSGTNTQVSGVDEGDIWKYDGEYFFVLKKKTFFDYPVFPTRSSAPVESAVMISSDPSISIEMNEEDGSIDDETGKDTLVDNTFTLEMISSPEIASLVGSAEAESLKKAKPCNEKTCAQLRIVHKNKTVASELLLEDIAPDEVFLTENKLILLGNQFASDNIWGGHRNSQLRKTQIQVYDTTDKSQLVNNIKINMDGHKIRSRRIGDQLYVVSRYTPHIKSLIEMPKNRNALNENLKIIDEITTDNILPKITINDEQQLLVKAEHCWLTVMPKMRWGARTLTIVTRINIQSGEFTSRCLGGHVEGIYMSQAALYLYNTSFQKYNLNEPMTKRIAIWNWNQGNTHIHKFSLSDLSYQGSALADGIVGHQHASFRFGELKDGSLGVVTSKNEWRNPEHRLTVFDTVESKWQPKALLPNEAEPSAIGKPGERIYSVRFMQDRAYIVTFQQTDPLYVIDLSDSSSPTIAGELEIPGFSDYLHPIGSDLLLGIGKEAKQNSNGATVNLGVKVALFDVANITDPQEVGTLMIGQRGSSTLLSTNHLAFAGIQQAESYRFAFPIHVHEGVDYYVADQEVEFAYHQWLHSGLYLFEVKDKTLSVSGAIITDQRSKSSTWASFGEPRGLIQGDDVFHLKGNSIYKANWLNPSETTEGPF